jgi:hypothetical protein
MFHGKSITITKVQLVETQIITSDVDVVDVNVTTSKATEELVFKNKEPHKARNVVDYEKEEWLKKSIVETIQQIKNIALNKSLPSTSMDGWNTT